MRIKLLAAIGLLAALAGPAVGADLGGSVKDGPSDFSSPAVVNWTGAYIQAQAGYAIFVEGYDGTDLGTSADVPVAGVRGGFDFARGRIVFGPFAEYNSIFSEDSTLESEWTIGGRLGLIVAPRTLVYGLLGYSHLTFDGSSVDSLNGVKAGMGGEFAIAGNLFASLEATHTWYDLPDAFPSDQNLDDTRVMAGIKLKLNSSLGF